jgi:hypothetical protein
VSAIGAPRSIFVCQPINSFGLTLIFLISIISQEFSWSKFLINEETFRKLITALRVFTPFLNLVHAFGEKTCEDEKICDSVYDVDSHDTAGLPAVKFYGKNLDKHFQIPIDLIVEFCYNIRFMELNGRNRGSRWSLRQSGIYQKGRSGTLGSIWILLQPPKHLRNTLMRPVANPEMRASHSPSCVLRLHLGILAAAGRSLAEYIEYLGELLGPLVCHRESPMGFTLMAVGRKGTLCLCG